MAINFNSFTEGTTSNIQSNDYVVGFDNTSPGGERKWTIPTIANGVNAFGWVVKTSNYTAVNGDKIAANTTSGAFTITLPASPASGSNVTITDANRTWDTNNLTIARNGQTIEGLGENLVCDVEGDMVVTLFFNGSTWRVYV